VKIAPVAMGQLLNASPSRPAGW